MRAIVQLRGEIDQSQSVRDTLSMLNLGRVNHATFVPETDTYTGMITKVNDHVAHGSPSAASVALVLRNRAEPTEGDDDIDDEWVATNTDYESVDALGEALVAEETTLQAVGISPTLRLHPPRGGHSGIKQPVVTGGELGIHETPDIDVLLEAMR